MSSQMVFVEGAHVLQSLLVMCIISQSVIFYIIFYSLEKLETQTYCKTLL